MTSTPPRPPAPPQDGGRVRRPRHRAFDDLALASAPVLVARPWIVLIPLLLGPVLAAVLRLPGIWLSVLAGVGLAGLVLAGTWTLRRAATWLGIVGAAALAAGVGVTLHGQSQPFALLPAPLAVAAAAGALAWTLRKPEPDWRVCAIVLVVAAFLLAALGLDSDELVQSDRPPAQAPLADVLLAVLLVAGARLGLATRWWIAAPIAVLALGALSGGEHWLGGLVTGLAIVPLVFATRVATAAREGAAACDRAAVRFVVRWQTRPWRSSLRSIGLQVLFVAGAAGYFGATLRIFGPKLPLQEVRYAVGMCVTGLMAGLWFGLPAAMLHFTHGVQWMLERTAAVVVPMLVLAALGMLLRLPRGWDGEAVGGIMLATAGPAVSAWVTGRVVLRRAWPFAVWAVVVGSILAAPLLFYSNDFSALAGVAYVLGITLCVHQLAHTRRVWRDAGIVPLVAFVAALGQPGAMDWAALTSWAGSCSGVAIALALLVTAARRARTMTAVPLHHPIYTDWGGPADV